MVSIFLVIIILGVVLFLQHPKFGRLPSEEMIKKYNSKNYIDGEFKNLEETTVLLGNEGTFSILFKNLMKNEILTPQSDIPTSKTNLKDLDDDKDIVIWLGHSSYFLKISGKNFLIDPVFSNYASPLPFIIKAFDGTTIYNKDDLPQIDYLVITHDHWDHLDYNTIKDIKNKVSNVITGLGVGNYLINWGYDKEKVKEGDWFESFSLENDIKLDILPSRHFSGRLFKRNQTIWSSVAIQSNKTKLYFSGDSGYGKHFKKIGEKFGGFDLVFLDSGQYDKRWGQIHMNPQEAVQAAEDLGARNLIPAHVARFKLAYHVWNEPFKILENYKSKVEISTPMIGKVINPKNPKESSSFWWKEVK